MHHFNCRELRLLDFAWVISHASKLTFSKNSFTNAIRVSNSLDPEQDRHSGGPDLGPNCLQRLSAEHKQGKSLLVLVYHYFT